MASPCLITNSIGIRALTWRVHECWKSVLAWVTVLLPWQSKTPESRYLGIEVHTPGVGKLLADVERRGIRNLKVFSDDAVQVLEDVIPVNSVDLMQIFFPILGIKNGIISGV